MNPSQLKFIENRALELGFDALGWAHHLIPEHADYFREWVKDKKYGDMTWFERTAEQRLDPTIIDINTRSALVLLTSYNHHPSEDNRVQKARYTFGDDYHVWIGERLEKLIHFIKTEIDSTFIGRSSVDTGHILERDLAVKAGLGWIGKNACLIHPKLGSFVLISVILCNIAPSGRDARSDVSTTSHCGSCTKCIDACPTHALEPHRLNVPQCRAYQANAKKGERDKNLWSCFGESILGCDLCQSVCPINSKAPLTRQKEWLGTFDKYAIDDLRDLLQMTEPDLKTRFKGSVLSRPYLDLMRNVFLVIAFQKRIDLLDAVEVWLERHKDVDLAECVYCLEVLRRGRVYPCP